MEKGLFRQSQQLAFLASGRAWTLLGSRENSKRGKCSKMPQNPTRHGHPRKMAGHLISRKDAIGLRPENALLGAV